MWWTLLLLNCKRGRPPEPPPVASTRPCLRNVPSDVSAAWEMVVLTPSAPLHAHRDDGAPFVPGKHTPARVLEEADGWLRVQIGDNLGCYFDPAGLAGLQLQVWTPAESLAPVITDTTRLEYSDGTALTVRAGLALLPTDTPGRYQLVDQLAVPELDIPGAIVGRRYREDHHWYAPADRGLDPDVVAAAALLNGAPISLLPSDDPWLWGQEGDDPGQAEFSSFCARYTVTVPASAWVDDVAGAVMYGISAPRAREGFVLEPGAPMWWPDDTPAGQSRCPEVFAVEARATDAGRRCFVRDPVTGWRSDLTRRDSGLVTLCFDAYPAPD